MTDVTAPGPLRQFLCNRLCSPVVPVTSGPKSVLAGWVVVSTQKGCRSDYHVDPVGDGVGSESHLFPGVI